MSHFTGVQTVMTNIDLVEAAMKQCGLNVVRNGVIRGYQGNGYRADIVAVLNGDYDLGYEKQGNEFVGVADFSMGPCRAGNASLTQLNKQIVATYAALNARRQAELNRSLSKANVEVRVY